MVRAHCARVRGSSAAFLGLLLALVVPLPCPVLHLLFLEGVSGQLYQISLFCYV